MIIQHFWLRTHTRILVHIQRTHARTHTRYSAGNRDFRSRLKSMCVRVSGIRLWRDNSRAHYFDYTLLALLPFNLIHLSFLPFFVSFLIFCTSSSSANTTSSYSESPGQTAMMILLISITILFLYIPNSSSWAGTSPSSSSCSSFSTVNILHGSGPAATLGLSLKFFTLLQARGLSLQNYRDLVVVTLFGPGSGMILERVPGKNLQEKRFQTSLKSHSLPGRRTWNVVDGGKTEKKKQRNYPRGQTRIGVV